MAHQNSFRNIFVTKPFDKVLRVAPCRKSSSHLKHRQSSAAVHRWKAKKGVFRAGPGDSMPQGLTNITSSRVAFFFMNTFKSRAPNVQTTNSQIRGQVTGSPCFQPTNAHEPTDNTGDCVRKDAQLCTHFFATANIFLILLFIPWQSTQVHSMSIAWTLSKASHCVKSSPPFFFLCTRDSQQSKSAVASFAHCVPLRRLVPCLFICVDGSGYKQTPTVT